ncbi:unnamed protein product (macronuclear) [Paramecium tetraurelia]|uniref:Uncharacterized protein n=1 Tax=Paramecium tetraurelia TaxID=5888 RepID=A0CA35_PARTE|nr:uncharacterized protein GSPATT00036431001 [Paramecium tetraurelia]CAK67652.1 unnamed protein product [Paramecium tetraurelia]|eukprot:XP_001435049.1 hypothetical protein (macronuclear) [Paramecium tetraurelia strain d4-2]
MIIQLKVDYSNFIQLQHVYKNIQSYPQIKNLFLFLISFHKFYLLNNLIVLINQWLPFQSIVKIILRNKFHLFVFPNMNVKECYAQIAFTLTKFHLIKPQQYKNFKNVQKQDYYELQISDQSQLKAQRLRFQIMINELEQKFKVFIQTIRQTTLKMYQEIESQEQFFYKFLTDNIALSNTSWHDINILVDILEGVKLTAHLKIKEQKLFTLQKLNSNLSNQISKLDKNLQNFTTTCQKIDQMIENQVQKIQKDIMNKIHIKWKDGIFRETGWY